MLKKSAAVALTFVTLAGCGISNPLSKGSFSTASITGPLPDRIVLKTRTESFTDEWYFAIRDGRIYYKPNSEKTGKDEAWKLLNGTGLPANPGNSKFTNPSRINEISAEFYHLIAISEKGTIYDTLITNEKAWKSTDKWGKPIPKTFALPENRGWGISVRNKGTTYTDPAGHVHTVGIGVTSLHILKQDGCTIQYGDPWLPDLSYLIYGPLRGRFIAEGMATGGSMLFLINKYGDMFTRLSDFDIDGNDPFYLKQYTFDSDSPESKRFLPAEDWKPQPKIDGSITKNLTVVQTGKDTVDRELRVEGLDKNHRGGYWAKPVKGGEWHFVATNAEVKGPFLDNRSGDCTKLALGPNRDINAQGTVTVRGSEMEAKLLQFNPECSPSTLQLKVGSQTIDCTLYIRRIYLKNLILGTLELPDSMLKSTDPTIKKVVETGFGSKKWTSLQIEQNNGKIRIHNKHYDVGPIPLPNPAGLLHPVEMEF